MDKLDFLTYKLLKKLYKVNDFVPLPNNRESRKLMSVKFVSRNQPLVDIMAGFEKPVLWMINDKGKEYYLNHFEANTYWWITTVIAVLALVISIIALVK